MLKIKEYRSKCGFTQAELANIIHTQSSVVAHWEMGDSSPRCEMLPRLADALGCTIDALFGREKKEDSA